MANPWTWMPGSTMKVCFVTTGATAPFPGLIDAVFKTPVLDALLDDNYTHLLIQYGTAQSTFESRVNEIQAGDRKLTIHGFDFDPNGLQSQFKLVQQSKGLVVSHAGSGSILEALRFQVALVVVPNTHLLDNHQEELAVAMERCGYLVHGDERDLSYAIVNSQEFKHKMAIFPPVTSGKHRVTKTMNNVMDETMGFLD